MKKLITLFVLFLCISCKKTEIIDPIQPILGAYYGDSAIQAIEPLLILAPDRRAIGHRALITKKDDKTLLIEYRYFANCTLSQGNCYEIRAIFTASMPNTPLSETTRIDFTGTCNYTFPNDPKLLNKSVSGYANLTAIMGDFVVNLPEYNGKPTQIKNKMTVRSTSF